MDSFNISFRDLGIDQSAVDSIASLRRTIGSLIGVHGMVKDVSIRLESIQSSLSDLQALDIREHAIFLAAKEALRKTGMATTVNECGQACDNFCQTVKKWNKQAVRDKISFVERTSASAGSREKIRTFQLMVEICQTTVNFAVNSTQLSIQKHANRTAEVDNEVFLQELQALESKTEERLKWTYTQYQEVQLRRQQLQEEPDEEEDDGAQRMLAIKEVNEQSRLIEAVRASLGYIYSQVNSRRTAQQIGNVTTSEDSKALVGLPVEVIGKIDQHVGDVLTTNTSSALVGVYDNVDMRGFFFTNGK